LKAAVEDEAFGAGVITVREVACHVAQTGAEIKAFT
jgi:hypothetical protein